MWWGVDCGAIRNHARRVKTWGTGVVVLWCIIKMALHQSMDPPCLNHITIYNFVTFFVRCTVQWFLCTHYTLFFLHITHQTHIILALSCWCLSDLNPCQCLSHMQVRCNQRGSHTPIGAHLWPRSRVTFLACWGVFADVASHSFHPPVLCSYRAVFVCVRVCVRVHVCKCSDMSFSLATGTVVVWRLILFGFLLVTFYFCCASNVAWLQAYGTV